MKRQIIFYKLGETEEKHLINTYKDYYYIGGSDKYWGLKGLKGTLKNVEAYAKGVLDMSWNIDERVFLWKEGSIIDSY